MAKIHVLSASGPNVYTVAIHATTPAGNNLAGNSWATCIQNSGRAGSVMPVGNGPGQITQSEMNQVTSGAIFESVMQWGDDPAWSNAERQADLDLRASQLVAETLAKLQTDLRYFGFTRT